jgi:site-specific DNA-methyltransferase (cytosine-N4-specific)
MDPFAGSNVTGQIAEQLDRKWIAVEINADYVAGSQMRFADAVPTRQERQRRVS